MSENKSQKSDGLLKIALPNGSLEEGTLHLFKDANLEILKDPRKHEARINDPLISQVTFMRPQHIPLLVENGTYDVGICGWDCAVESDTTNFLKKPPTPLAFGRHSRSSGKGRVVLVGEKNNPAQGTAEIPEKAIIFSEYPNITRRFFQIFEKNKWVTVECSYGGTEAHIPRDYRYGVCFTETGESLAANGLKIISVILQTQTFLAESPLIKCLEKRRAIKTLKHLLIGVLEAREQTFLVMNVSLGNKNKVLKKLPALKTPTITPLLGGTFFSVGAAVRKSEITQLIPQLLQNGAKDLIEMPVSKVIRTW